MTKPAETISATRSDGDLLTEFVAQRQDPAFAELARRHGGMVLSVCRSVLGNSQDAEDAAQAVFLTLALRAPSLEGRTTLAGWLYRVAWFVATRAAKARLIRLRHEREVARMKPNSTTSVDEGIPLEMLYGALAGLPEKDRLPLLLHHLEGRSEQETASLLRCSVSAVSMRLTRGRQLLRERLVKRGVTASGVGLVAVMGDQASAGVTPTFVTTASHTAVAALAGKTGTAVASASVMAFSKGALNMLFWAKMKLVAMVTAAILLGGGAGVAKYVVAAGNQPSPATAPTTAPAIVAGAQAAEMVDNPNYQEWAKYKPGTFVTLKVTGITDGASAPVTRVSTTTTTLKLISVDAAKVVVEMTMTSSTGGAERTMPARTSDIRAKIQKHAAGASGDDKEEVSEAKTGTDTVEFKGQKLATTTQEQTTKMVGSGLTIHTKAWISGEVPCGVVKMEITRAGPIAGTSTMELVDFAVVK